VGDALGQEVRPFQVHGNELIEGFFARLQDVGADARRDAGVVDKQVNASVGA
jgi:hypothetical protein